MITIKRSREDLIFDIVIYLVLGFSFLVVAYPLYFLVIASISDPYAVLNGDVIFYPLHITFDGYQRIFRDHSIWNGYMNTIIYTVVGTILNVALTIMIAYPLSRKYFSGRKIIMWFLMITMYFNGGLIPTYLLVKSMGLRNNWMIMVILGAVSIYNIIITRSFLESNIHEELEQAASIDGCSQFVFFIKMVLPLSKAIIAVLVLYYGVSHWNDFMRALIYLSDQKKYPLQLILRTILIQTQMSANMTDDIQELEQQMRAAESIKYGVIIVSSLPVLVIYPFLQRYFIQGVMIGSIKG